MRVRNREITFFIALSRWHRRGLAGRAAHDGVDEARRSARLGNPLGETDRGIDHSVRRNAIEKSKLKKPHPHDCQRLGLSPRKFAPGEMRQLEVQTPLPCERTQHQARDQPSVGGSKFKQPRAEQNVGIAGLLIDAIKDLDRRHPRREPFVSSRRSCRCVRHVPNRAPTSTRLPRRKSAADILLRPGACTSTSFNRPVPHCTTGSGLTLTILPGESLLPSSFSTATRQMRTSSAPSRVRATGHGSYARVIRSICAALKVQSTTAFFFSTCEV